MKKKILYLVLVLAFSSVNILISVAQPTLDFVRGIGGSANDYGASIAALDSSGSNLIYTTGVFRGSTVNFNPAGTAKTLNASGGVNADFYIGKYSTTGFLTASTGAAFRVGSTTDLDLSDKIYVDASGNIYVVGTCTGNSFFDKSMAAGGMVGGSGVGFVAKYDKNFALQWGFVIGEPTISAGTEVKDITVDIAGNVYITGRFQSTASVNFNPGPTAVGGASPDPGPFAAINLSSAGNFDMFAAKYNSGGKCLWAINSGGTSSDEGWGIGTDGTNVFLTGIFRGQNIDFDPSASVKNLSETGGGSVSGDVFVAKYSTSGTFVDAFNFGNALFEGSTGIAVDPSTGSFAISGYFAKDALAIDFDPDPIGTAYATAVGTSGTDLFIVKYSSALAYQWHKTVGSTGNEKANAIKLSGNNLFITGSYEGTATDFGKYKYINYSRWSGCFHGRIFFLQWKLSFCLYTWRCL